MVVEAVFEASFGAAGVRLRSQEGKFNSWEGSLEF